MRLAARAALDAEDLTAAANATSQLGLACGGCHVASNVTVEFDEQGDTFLLLRTEKISGEELPAATWREVTASTSARQSA